jgi:hypothetical protein
MDDTHSMYDMQTSIQKAHTRKNQAFQITKSKASSQMTTSPLVAQTNKLPKCDRNEEIHQHLLQKPLWNPKGFPERQKKKEERTGVR